MINTEVRIEDNISGTSPDNAIPLLSQVDNNEASVTTTSSVTNNNSQAAGVTTENVEEDQHDEQYLREVFLLSMDPQGSSPQSHLLRTRMMVW